MSPSGDMSCVEVDWSRIITIFCCSIRPTFLVMCGLSCSCLWLLVVPVSVLLLFFYNRHSYFYLLYLISKRIFHLGGLVSKMHISVYMLLSNGSAFAFLHLLNTILGL